jgi:hypothetical protein
LSSLARHVERRSFERRHHWRGPARSFGSRAHVRPSKRNGCSQWPVSGSCHNASGRSPKNSVEKRTRLRPKPTYVYRAQSVDPDPQADKNHAILLRCRMVTLTYCAEPPSVRPGAAKTSLTRRYRRAVKTRPWKGHGPPAGRVRLGPCSTCGRPGRNGKIASSRKRLRFLVFFYLSRLLTDWLQMSNYLISRCCLLCLI